MSRFDYVTFKLCGGFLQAVPLPEMLMTVSCPNPASPRLKPPPECTTPQFRTLWSAWLFTDVAKPVERSAGECVSNAQTQILSLIKKTLFKAAFVNYL